MRILPRRRAEISFPELHTVIAKFFLPRTSREKLILEFENAFSAFVGVKHAVAVPKARIGLCVLLDSLGLRENDEVIVASYNYHVIPAILRNKKLKPVFVDVDERTWNIDPSQIESKITPKTKCLIATHLFGKSCDMDTVAQICRRRNLLMIEDAAHACGGEYKGEKIGSLGDVSFFSFGTGKALVAFGGGMLLTDHDRIAVEIRSRLAALVSAQPRLNANQFVKSVLETVCTQKIIFPFFVYPVLRLVSCFDPGLIDRLIEDKVVLEEGKIDEASSSFTWLQAALGLAQLQRVAERNRKRICFAELLNDLLKDVDQVRLPQIEGNNQHTALYYCLVAKQSAALRQYLFKRGIDTKRGTMRACSSLSFFGNKEPCPVAESMDPDVVELPCYPSLELKDIYYQVNLIRMFYGKEPKPLPPSLFSR